LLREHDLGLALMYTPHPSLVPMEMASAGMVAVTNSFENKGPDAMAAISLNILVCDPSIDGVVEGLAEGAARVEDHEARVGESRVRWSRDWSQSFDQPLLDRLSAVLQPAAPVGR
jgi:hypothetical protein